MACIACRKKLTDDYISCPHTTNVSQRKLPNDPDYFGVDELKFIKYFGDDIQRSFQQIRHLKAASTGTAKTLLWLLKADHTNGDDICDGSIGTAGKRRHLRGKKRAEINMGLTGVKGAKIKRRAGFYKRKAECDNLQMGANWRAMHGRGDMEKPLVPLTYCFNVDGQHLCRANADKGAALLQGRHEPPYRLRPDQEFRASHRFHGQRDTWSVQKDMWCELIKGQIGGGSVLGEGGAFGGAETLEKAKGAYGKPVEFRRPALPAKAHIYRASRPSSLTRQAKRHLMRARRTPSEVLREEHGRDRKHLKALKALYADLNEPPKVLDEEEERRESDNIYKFYLEQQETLDDGVRAIEKLGFAELVELLKKEGHKKFETVLFHEPFDRDKPWTWMEAFPVEIPEKYLKHLSTYTLAILSEWQSKQKIAKADKGRKKGNSKKQNDSM